MNNGNGQRQRKPNEIGAAWIKQSERGEYVSIQFNEQVSNFDLSNCFIDMYFNDRKTNPKAPDYRILAKEKTQQRQQRQPQAPQRNRFPGRQNQFTNEAPPSAPPAGNWDDEDPGY